MLNFRNLLSATLVVFLLSGCVNTPTQTANIKDDRPMITFDGAWSNDILILDGITIGSASEYRSGHSALKIESGTHRLEIIRDGEVIISERFYISDGATKTFIVQAEQ